VDASVVQVVRWQGAGAQADWASSHASATPPACGLGGVWSRSGSPDAPLPTTSSLRRLS